MTKNKICVAIAILLMLSIGASMTVLPIAIAHTPAWQITTFAYINVSPNPVGAGQPVNVLFWLDKRIGSTAAYNDIRFKDYTLTITKPDGTKETKVWAKCEDTTSAQYFNYIPVQVGTYTLKFDYPGQLYTWTDAYQNDTYLASTATTTLTVQEEPLPNPITSYPLPQEYWTRPIYSENTDWWAITSNWYGSGSPQVSIGNFGRNAYIHDGVGPLTAHIMWTKVLQSGGVVGGDDLNIQGDTYFEGSAYINRYSNPIVVAGKIYYTEPVSFPGGSTGPTTCVDLRTGEELWSRKDVPSLSFAHVFGVHQMNQHGVYLPILCTNNFAMMFDADTGDWLCNVTNVPTGSLVMGPDGEHLRYVIANAGNTTHPDWRLGQWNSSLLWDGWGYSGSTTFRPSISGVVDGGISNQSSPICRYDWNVSIPWCNTMKTVPLVFGAYYNDMLLCANGTLGRLPGISAQGIQDGTPITYFAVNLNPSKGAIGSVLWRNTISPPAGNKTVVPNAVDPVNRVFLENYRETVEWVGYNMDTGQKIWGPTQPQTNFAALDYYGNQFSGHMLAEVAYGNFYVVGFAGILYCYDIKSGSIKWTYGNGGEGNSTNAGYYTPRGHYPTMTAAIASGVIYLETTEHTVTTPIYKGARTRAVNATDGTEIWTLSDYTGGGRSMAAYAIADGYATWFNGYDNQIYVVGRGPSDTTVAVSPKVSVHGSSVLLEGTVMDTAAGTENKEQAARFPNGVPAVSDASMIEWMEYVYQQKPKPTEVAGVPVIVEVIDSNNNRRTIGTATTDIEGSYSLLWTPEITGKYTVIATFAGTEGYWPSHAETYFGVDPAPEAQAEVTIPPDNSGTYATYSTIAIIAAIAIVGAVIVLVLRKR